MNPNVVEIDGNEYLQCQISEGEETSFEIGCNSYYNMSTNVLDKAIEDANYNALCNNYYHTEINESGQTIPYYECKPFALRFQIEPNDDEYASELDYTPYRPIIFRFDGFSGETGFNLLETVRMLKYDGDPNEIYEQAYSLKLEHSDNILETRLFTPKDFDYNVNDYVITKGYKYFYNKENDKVINQIDDGFHASLIKLTTDQEPLGITYYGVHWRNDNGAYKKNNGILLGNTKYMMVFGGKEYFNSDYETDNIVKSVRAYNFGNIISFDPVYTSEFKVSTMTANWDTTSTEDISDEAKTVSFTMEYVLYGKDDENNKIPITLDNVEASAYLTALNSHAQSGGRERPYNDYHYYNGNCTTVGEYNSELSTINHTFTFNYDFLNHLDHDPSDDRHTLMMVEIVFKHKNGLIYALTHIFHYDIAQVARWYASGCVGECDFDNGKFEIVPQDVVLNNFNPIP